MKTSILLLLILSISLYSQVTEEWVTRYNGPGNGIDEAESVVTDNFGNIYVTGRSQGSTSGFNYATIKYDSDGNEQWQKRYGTSEIYRANADGEEPSETRPTVLMDLTFNGFTYKDIEVGLDSRPRAASDLLVNRDLMRQMNVSVNPNRTFVLSKRLKPIEKEGKQDKVGFEKK